MGKRKSRKKQQGHFLVVLTIGILFSAGALFAKGKLENTPGRGSVFKSREEISVPMEPKPPPKPEIKQEREIPPSVEMPSQKPPDRIVQPPEVLETLPPKKSLKKANPHLKRIFDGTSDKEELRVIVRFLKKPEKADIEKIEQKRGKIHRKFTLLPAAAIKIKKEDLVNLDELPEVTTIEPDLLVKAFLDISLDVIQVKKGREEFQVTGKNIKVAVLDTGVKKDHPALLGKVTAEVDFTGEGPQDLNGHGTHVACIISCNHEIYSGVSPEAFIYNGKVLDKFGAGYASDVMAGIEWAVSQNVDVINVSLGAQVDTCDGKDALSETVDRAVERGIVAVVAAGNSGPAYSTINSPGCSELAITVGAVDDFRTIASFSSRGPTVDSRVKPDLVAPGVHIMAASVTNDFIGMSGTSMATPHVSGVIALIKEAAQTLTPSQIKETVLQTAKRLPYDAFTVGRGLINSFSAISSTKSLSLEEPLQKELEKVKAQKESERPGLPRGYELAKCLKSAKGDREERKQCFILFSPGKALGIGKKPPSKLKKTQKREGL